MKKVLFYFPQKFYPPQTGAHKRCLQLLLGLKALGCDIVFASSAYRNRAWTDVAAQEVLKFFGCEISLFRPNLWQRGVSAAVDYSRKWFFRSYDCPQRIVSVHRKEWFSSLLDNIKPDILVMNYANSDAFVDLSKLGGCVSVMEMHDLISLNNKMQLSMIKDVGLNSIITGSNIDKILELDYFDRLSIDVDSYEYEIYDKYKYTLCISEDEKQKVALNTRFTTTVHIPMTHEVKCIDNTYDSESLFCSGSNPFNNQGYYYFVKKILPLIRRKRPDYCITVTGNFYNYISPTIVDSVKYLGFVSDLKPLYLTMRFFVCPVFGGTGQQVKIVEAMAHGLPVVAFSSAASRSPIRHAENGLIANSAEEFAEYVLSLWCDKELCRKLGKAARLTIAKEYHQNRLLEKLSPILI